MIVEYVSDPKTPKVIQAGNLVPGQIGKLIEFYSDRVSIGSYLLGTYSGPVALHNPRITWDHQCSLLVEIMPPGSTFTITTEI